MTKNEIRDNILVIRKVMDQQCGIDNPEGVLEKLNDISNVLGLSGHLIAQAKRHYNQKQAAIVGELFKLKAQDRKLKMETEATDEQYLIDETTALNKDLHYCEEACRSMLSYLKNEMNQRV